MKRLSMCLVAGALLSSCAPAASPPPPPDAVTADPGHYKVVLENDAVRVLRISYGPGERSQMHQHPDGMIVALAGTTTRFNLPDGTSRDSELLADTALYAPAESHNPENTGTTGTDVILVEFKTAAAGTAMLPEMREGLAMTVLAEGPRATAYRSTADPTFVEPEGTVHDYDQVVIALGAAEVPLTVDGELVRSTWARGDVAFIGRGKPHSSSNMSGGPVEFVLVAIK